jgi:hypothetical protein
VESSCELGNEPSSSKNAGNYRVAAQVVASRVVLSSTELVMPTKHRRPNQQNRRTTKLII